MGDQPQSVQVQVADLLALVALVSQDLSGGPDVERTVQQGLALVLGRPGGQGTGVSICVLGTRGRVASQACSDDRAARVTQMQQQLGEGPCWRVITDPGVSQVYVADVAGDSRYPTWGPQAAAVGVGSAVAFALTAGTRPLGALSLFAPDRYGFDERTRAEGRAFAAQLAAAVHARRLEQHLRDGRQSRTSSGRRAASSWSATRSTPVRPIGC